MRTPAHIIQRNIFNQLGENFARYLYELAELKLPFDGLSRSGLITKACKICDIQFFTESSNGKYCDKCKVRVITLRKEIWLKSEPERYQKKLVKMRRKYAESNPVTFDFSVS